MISQQEADHLLALEKHILDGDEEKDKYILAATAPIVVRIPLIAKENHDVSFIIDITQSSRNRLKLSLHCQEDGSKIGLLRVEFNSRHLNPEIVENNVPPIFAEYAGQWIQGSHIHYFVEGYKPLAWAIPINVDDTFALKEFTDGADEGNAIALFAKRVNVKTVIHTEIQNSMKL